MTQGLGPGSGPELIGPYRTSTRIYQLEARILPHRLAVSVQENITVSPARLEQSSQLLLSLPNRPSIERRAQIDAAMYSEICPLYDAIGEGSMHQRGALGHDAGKLLRSTGRSSPYDPRGRS
ncbi:hypothetical protein HYQ46_001597 [Verticillium longisporum]|nr:hypothetical protein HYQ46_001597 [Verticillium longisporum]